MKSITDFVTKSPLISTLLASAILSLIAFIWKKWANSKDSQTIIEFFKSSDSQTNFSFLSIHVISAHTNIPEKRIELLCSRHSKIQRNERVRDNHGNYLINRSLK